MRRPVSRDFVDVPFSVSEPVTVTAVVPVPVMEPLAHVNGPRTSTVPAPPREPLASEPPPIDDVTPVSVTSSDPPVIVSVPPISRLATDVAPEAYVTFCAPGTQTWAPAPGRTLPLQFAASVHAVVPAPPSHVTVGAS